MFKNQFSFKKHDLEACMCMFQQASAASSDQKVFEKNLQQLSSWS